MKIVFTNTFGINIESPKPGSKILPTWYKDLNSYLNNEKKPIGDGTIAPTIKRCIPVLDSLTSGYIITLPTDIHVSIKEDENGKKVQWFEWPSFPLIQFHPIDQALNHPLSKPYPYPKFMNPWSIKTPKGYSTLFVQPFHRESVFTILPGIVDTDIYTAPVNFPFVINDPNFEGYIKRGTPIAQAIPIKRDKWTMEMGNQEDYFEQNGITQKLKTKFFDSYKSTFWDKKEYL
jgi:hypothetical protein